MAHTSRAPEGWPRNGPKIDADGLQNHRKVYQREGTVSGLGDEGQIALWELKQYGSVAALRLRPTRP